jgi:hypothetical protein
VCCSDLLSVEISDGAVINCSDESCVKVVNKYNLQSQTPRRVTLTNDNIKDITFLSFLFSITYIFCYFKIDVGCPNFASYMELGIYCIYSFLPIRSGLTPASYPISTGAFPYEWINRKVKTISQPNPVSKLTITWRYASIPQFVFITR